MFHSSVIAARVASFLSTAIKTNPSCIESYFRDAAKEMPLQILKIKAVYGL